jgi:hypothetical protein
MAKLGESPAISRAIKATEPYAAKAFAKLNGLLARLNAKK